MCKRLFALSLLFVIVFTKIGLLKTDSVIKLPPPVGKIYVNISNITAQQNPPRRWELDDENALKKMKFINMKLPCSKMQFSLEICSTVKRYTSCLDLCNPEQKHEINLKGRMEIIMNWSKSAVFQPGLGFVFSYEYQCTTACDQTITLAPDISNIIKPPDLKYRNCRCVWNVRVSNERYVIKSEFITLNLAKSNLGHCLDEIVLIDTGDSTTSGPYCGNSLPKPVKTSKNNLKVVYTTRNILPSSNHFELLVSNEKKEGDLAGLQSVAAVLGAISFGVFIGLMLCSVLYKRWSRGRPDGEARAEAGNNYDDYDDAIQRAAPPSYDKVLAAPKDYPSTPQASPTLTRTLPTVDPPDYPGIDDEDRPQIHAAFTEVEPRCRQNSPVGVEMMHVPPPNYDIVSESEDDWFPVKRSPVKTKLVGKNGRPPTYRAVTSEGSDIENLEATPGCSTDKSSGNKNRLRTSRSKRSLSSSIRNAQTSHADSDDSDDEEDTERETRRKRYSNIIATSPPSSDLPVISSNSEGEVEELQRVDLTPVSIDDDRPVPPNLLTIPIPKSANEHSKSNIIRSRSYTDLARHAIINSIERRGHTAPSSPEVRRRAQTDTATISASPPLSSNNTTNYGSVAFENTRITSVPDGSQGVNV